MQLGLICARKNIVLLSNPSNAPKTSLSFFYVFRVRGNISFLIMPYSHAELVINSDKMLITTTPPTVIRNGPFVLDERTIFGDH